MTDHPTQDEIFAIVAKKVAEQKEIEVSEIALDSKFEDLGVDSLDAMEILFELEDELDLDIPDQAARAMRTVADVVDGLGKLARGEEIEVPDTPVAATSDGDDETSSDRAGAGPEAAAGG